MPEKRAVDKGRGLRGDWRELAVPFDSDLWETHAGLRMCSLAAQGFWARCIARMCDGVPRGTLSVNGHALDVAQIATLIGVPASNAAEHLAELERWGVAHKNAAGAYVDRFFLRLDIEWLPAWKRAVFDRDGWLCRGCGGVSDLTIDHDVPRTRGGTDLIDNLQTLCRTCNSSKGARTMMEWLRGATP